jgi:hypothetical protein
MKKAHKKNIYAIYAIKMGCGTIPVRDKARNISHRGQFYIFTNLMVSSYTK